MSESFRKVSWGSVSITGQFRSNNEDSVLIDRHGRYFLVADGMGGQSAGERASSLAVEVISEKLNAMLNFEAPADSQVVSGIDRAVASANSEIMALGELEPNCKNMGTTITFLVNIGRSFFVGGVGDSRTYILRNKQITQLTEDHSLTYALVKAGTITAEAAKTHRYRNVLYRFLGTKEGGLGTQARRIVPQAGDRFLLCSDGVTDGAPVDQLRALLAESTDPQQTADKVVKTAEAGGSRDNITCIVIHVD